MELYKCLILKKLPRMDSNHDKVIQLPKTEFAFIRKYPHFLLYLSGFQTIIN